MKVRMKVSMHGPEVAREPGQVHEVSEEEGLRLIASDFAEAVEDSSSGKQAAKRQARQKT